MAFTTADRERLLALLDALCDQRATDADRLAIEELVLADDDARWLYLTYMDLHGTLVWDGGAAAGVVPVVEATPDERSVTPDLSTVLAPSEAATLSSRRWKSPRMLAAATMSAAVLLGLGILLGRYALPMPGDGGPIVAQSLPGTENTAPVPDADATDAITTPRPAPRGPVVLGTPGSMVADKTVSPSTEGESDGMVAVVPDPSAPAHSRTGQPDPAPPATEPPVDVDDLLLAKNGPEDDVTAVSRKIDRFLARDWKDLQLTPSPRASDQEWLRRVMLDLAGRIPSVAEAEAFLTESSPRLDRRRELVDRLLNDGEYVNHFSTVWLNLLVGRAPQPRVDRVAFQKYLRDALASNRPWNAIVAELLSAEGRTDENGATNYLVAHLNNQAVPATAITSRLFLGQQLHCAQCHNHPFNRIQQASFWELNSLFQQTAVVSEGKRDGNDMRSNRPSARIITRLETQPEGGPIYYETTNGLMKVAFPRFNGQDVDPAPSVNRRQELARLLTTTEQPQLAAAFVNRTWAQFFGAGFTTPIDDMGPHNPPCHPEVLELLRDEFIRSGYDVKQLIRWITATDAYQRTSAPGDGNRTDDPVTGDLPAFSRVYPRPMTAEQLFDSLVTATQAHQRGKSDWTAAEAQRQAWLAEFVVSMDNDENDEAETLSGTHSQALTLMNGELMESALQLAPGTVLGDLVHAKLSEAEKIRRLTLAALTREPTPKELPAMLKLVRAAGTRKGAGSRSPEAGYQDLFWALLNSNEFTIVH